MEEQYGIILEAVSEFHNLRNPEFFGSFEKIVLEVGSYFTLFFPVGIDHNGDDFSILLKKEALF